MAAKRRVELESKDAVLPLRMLDEAYSDFHVERIRYFVSYRGDENTKCVYLLTDNHLYMYDSSNVLTMMEDLIFRIPVNLIKTIGMEHLMISDVIFVEMTDGKIIPIKYYGDSKEIEDDITAINTILHSDLLNTDEDFIDEQFRGVSMVMTKPTMSAKEYHADLLSPFEFDETPQKKYDYLIKKQSLIKKLQKKPRSGAYSSSFRIVDIDIQELMEKLGHPLLSEF